MIIEHTRQFVQRSSARVVFPDALDVRVLKAANYPYQHGLAYPILAASPFALRQFVLSHRVVMDGIQVIDLQSNQPMYERPALRWLACTGDKTPVGALGKLNDPLIFVATMVSVDKADACVAGSLSSTANAPRVELCIIGLRPGYKMLSSIPLTLPRYLGSSLGFVDCSVVPQPIAAQLVDTTTASIQIWQVITGEEPCVATPSFSSKGNARHSNIANVQQTTGIVRERAL